ncbi:MAG: keto-hydroxyglutarate-aldolase/keto-deoxy-phosphogluconate aldolase, partial [Anaerolineae bacterium]|nr:keto-hydroxyglutarate-aldolase/keto-deoxy-phosphogluconate aldolase [Anaerolineae bacterium]
MNQFFQQIGELGVVPVVAIEDPDDAPSLAEALLKGGLPCAEITFRTSAAAEAIKAITDHFPDMLVGAGTV